MCIGLLAVIVLAFAGLSAFSRGKPPTGLAGDGRLSPCPDSPNCVCSEADSLPSSIAPLAFTGSPDTAPRGIYCERSRQAVGPCRPRTATTSPRHIAPRSSASSTILNVASIPHPSSFTSAPPPASGAPTWASIAAAPRVSAQRSLPSRVLHRGCRNDCSASCVAYAANCPTRKRHKAVAR